MDPVKNSTLSRAMAPVFLLTAGSSLYYLLEVLARGWSHWTMAVCGGLCLLLIYYMNRRLTRLPLLLRAASGALIITAVELAAGCFLNLGLGLAIWDYSGRAAHLWGQICLYASARWFLLCIPVCAGCGFVERHVFGDRINTRSRP